MFDRFARAFTRWFGSAGMFTAVTLVIILWIVPIAWLGAGGWNATAGLAGNTIESTFELLLAIAIQYTAVRVEHAQQRHMEAIERLERTIAERLGVKEGSRDDDTDDET